MLNKERHQLIMGQILKDIYTNTRIAPLVGFKGGTCAYFFYGLPRFSVDLDFDLLVPGEENIKKVFQEIQAIIGRYGAIKDECVKLNTILFEMSYGPEDRNIKIEISVREWPFDIRENMPIKNI
ncbi:nucleotidyl transferase AbiEii/AbiGii toxin family protein [Patescibacteria group bacterium]|nr:nucleotidyl transferase AbiEii/AbiGii toxin family protein [Patescibacteria group bacterium]